MTEPKRITVQVGEELHHAARVQATQERRSLSNTVRLLIEMWLRGDVVLPDATEDQTAEA